MAQGLRFESYLIAFMLISVCMVSFYSFATSSAENYGGSTAIVDDNLFNMTGLEDAINATNMASSDWEQAFSEEDKEISFGELIGTSIWSVVKLMITSINAIVFILLGALSNVFGVSPLVTGTIITLVVVALIFSAWRVIKGSE